MAPHLLSSMAQSSATRNPIQAACCNFDGAPELLKCPTVSQPAKDCLAKARQVQQNPNVSEQKHLISVSAKNILRPASVRLNRQQPSRQRPADQPFHPALAWAQAAASARACCDLASALSSAFLYTSASHELSCMNASSSVDEWCLGPPKHSKAAPWIT